MVLRKYYRNQTEICLYLNDIFGWPLLNIKGVEECFVEYLLFIWLYNTGNEKQIYGLFNRKLHGFWASQMPYFYVLNGQQFILIVKLSILSTVLYFIQLIQLYIMIFLNL